jgi:hypothetical protein
VRQCQRQSGLQGRVGHVFARLGLNRREEQGTGERPTAVASSKAEGEGSTFQLADLEGWGALKRCAIVAA